MKKSVYSLVLSDDVVRAVDHLAYQKHTSRSNLINQILAEYCSFTTPEKRMKDIFSFVEDFIMPNEALQVRLQSSDAMMSIRSALRYKYKPTIRYVVELNPAADRRLGELRVSFRTQNQQLIALLTQFFIIWNQLEKHSIGTYFDNGEIPCEISEGKYRRIFMAPEQALSEEQVGRAIAGYVQMLDQVLKTFFDYMDTPQEAVRKTEQMYDKLRNHLMPVI